MTRLRFICISLVLAIGSAFRFDREAAAKRWLESKGFYFDYSIVWLRPDGSKMHNSYVSVCYNGDPFSGYDSSVKTLCQWIREWEKADFKDDETNTAYRIHPPWWI